MAVTCGINDDVRDTLLTRQCRHTTWGASHFFLGIRTPTEGRIPPTRTLVERERTRTTVSASGRGPERGFGLTYPGSAGVERRATRSRWLRRSTRSKLLPDQGHGPGKANRP